MIFYVPNYQIIKKQNKQPLTEQKLLDQYMYLSRESYNTFCQLPGISFNTPALSTTPTMDLLIIETGYSTYNPGTRSIWKYHWEGG